MTSKVKNIIIFAAVGIALVLIYIFFIKKAPEQATLVSTPSSVVVSTSDTSSSRNSSVNQDFLSLLLNVKNIRLDTTIFSDLAFINLHDSSIVLVPDGTEGRDNPFAPIGFGNLALPSSNINVTNALPPPVINNVNNPPPIIMPN